MDPGQPHGAGAVRVPLWALLLVVSVAALAAAVALTRPPWQEATSPAATAAGNRTAGTKVLLFKSPTCGCCGQYVSYLGQQGFRAEVTDLQNMSPIKERYGIPAHLQSCHTSVVGDYFVEGHVPVEVIRKLLGERPAIDGIALPGMPHGAPGMGGHKMGPLQIYGLADGGASEFVVL